MNKLTTPEVRARIGQNVFLQKLNGDILEGKLIDVCFRVMYVQEMDKERLTEVSIKDLYKYHFEDSDFQPTPAASPDKILATLTQLDKAVTDLRRALKKIAKNFTHEQPDQETT
jgi:hypothetical protein